MLKESCFSTPPHPSGRLLYFETITSLFKLKDVLESWICCVQMTFSLIWWGEGDSLPTSQEGKEERIRTAVSRMRNAHAILDLELAALTLRSGNDSFSLSMNVAAVEIFSYPFLHFLFLPSPLFSCHSSFSISISHLPPLKRTSCFYSYLYEIARRNPFVFAPVLLTVASRFEEAATTCCEQQQKATCFQAKVAPITQHLKAVSSYQKNVCGAFIKFGPKVLNSINIAVFSKKFPKIGFKDLTSLLEDVSSMYDGCCEGDVVQCIRSQSQVMNHICSKQDSISSKIKACCEKKTPAREDCIINANKDDRPEDLSLRTAKFTDSENVCQERDSDPDKFFAEFIYEYSRRHTDLSTPELLRITKVYMNLLEDCCSRESPADCYRHAEDKFNETTERSLAMVQQECKQFQKLGKDTLQHHFLVKFTKAAPQLPMEELVSLSKEMVAALTTCCTLSDEFACVDNLADLVLGELCGINKNRTINPTVDHCCKTDFAFRRHCFEHLKADTTYALPSVSALVSALRADWCQPSKEDLQNKKHRFLVNLVKWMPEITDEERLCLFTKFTAAGEECGQVQEPESCFSPESPKTGNKSQAAEKQR